MSRTLIRGAGAALFLLVAGGIIAANYTAGVALLIGIGLFITGALITRVPKLVLIVAAMSVGAAVLFLVSSSTPPRMTGPAPSATPGPDLARPPTVQRFTVSDYLARVRPATDGTDAFLIEEHVILTPELATDRAPIELQLPRRVVQSQSIGLAARRVKFAPPDSEALRAMIPREEVPPNTRVVLAFPYRTRLRFDVIGLPAGAFTQPLLSSEAPVQSPGQVSWTTDVHDQENGFEYYGGPALLQPAFMALRNLSSLGQGFLVLLTNIVLYTWIKIFEPLLSDLVRTTLKRRLRIPDPNAAPVPAR